MNLARPINLRIGDNLTTGSNLCMVVLTTRTILIKEQSLGASQLNLREHLRQAVGPIKEKY